MKMLPETPAKKEKYMKKETRKILVALGLISFTVILLAVALNFGSVYHAVAGFLSVFMPFFVGIAIAFFLNVPMRFMENKVLRSPKLKKIKRPLAIVLTLVLVFGIISAVLALIVPQLTKTVSSIVQSVPQAMENMNDYQAELSEKYPQFADTIGKVNLSSERIVNEVLGFVNEKMQQSGEAAMQTVTGTLGGMLNFFIGLIFAIYILSQKEKLKQQTRHVLDAYLKPDISQNIWKTGKLASVTFQNFISGQCLEACILGSLFFVAMLIFRMPYALLISVLIAVTALIPIWGAFIGCFIGCLLIAVVNPMQALGFLIMFLIIQQIEGNLIYPHVVGGSIGLPSIWVLLAVTVGGKLYGIVGMIFFIPLCSVLYALLKENVRFRLKQKSVVREEQE